MVEIGDPDQGRPKGVPLVLGDDSEERFVVLVRQLREPRHESDSRRGELDVLAAAIAA